MSRKTDRVIVVCGIMKKDGKILIARPKKKDEPLEQWEFPGGKVQPGETESKALIREFREELNINIDPGELVGTSQFNLANGQPAELKAYNVEYLNGNITLRVHEEIRYIAFYEISDYAFLGPDQVIIQILEKARLNEVIEETTKLRENGQAEKALQRLLELHKNYSDEPETAYQVAWTYQSMGKENEAVQFYVEALNKGLQGQKRRETWLVLVYTFINAGEIDEAFKYIELLQEESGEEADSLLFECIAHIKNENKVEAIKTLLIILRDYSNNQRLQNYTELLNYFIETWK